MTSLVQSAGLPVFFAYSANEGGPLPKMKADLSSSTNVATTIREFERAGHGCADVRQSAGSAARARRLACEGSALTSPEVNR